MINVIHTSSVDSFDHLLFPEQNPMNDVYIRQQLSNYSSSLTDIGRNFIETSKRLYEKVNDSNAVRLAKAAVRMAKGLFHPNAIVPLETLDSIRSAQPIMQRFIMAEPTIRALYHEQKCDGYSDTYADLEHNRIKDDHYDYRRVMNSIVQDVVTDDGSYDWVSKNYFEELHPNDKHLTFDEKISVLKTWDVLKMFIESSEDPTNIFGGEIAP